MNELFLGALDLSPYYRNIECSHGNFRLFLRDIPEDLFIDLKTLIRCRLRLVLYANGLNIGEQPAVLHRMILNPINYADVGRPIFERRQFPQLVTHILEGAFADAIPF